MGQLLVAILALRTPTHVSAAGVGGPRLARDRRSLNALILAAVALLIAATALLKVESSNQAWRDLNPAFDKPSAGAAENALEPWVARILVAAGMIGSGASIFFSRRAWSGWSGPAPEAVGVALAALLAMVAGVVAVFLLASLSQFGP